MHFKSLLFIKSSYDAPLLAQTSFPIYLPLIYLFFFQAKNLDITFNLFFTYCMEPLSTNPYTRRFVPAPYYLESTYIFPSSNYLPIKLSSSLIWTKLFTLDLLLSFLHIAAGMVAFRHKSHYKVFPTSKSCIAPYLQE